MEAARAGASRGHAERLGPSRAASRPRPVPARTPGASPGRSSRHRGSAGTRAGRHRPFVAGFLLRPSHGACRGAFRDERDGFGDPWGVRKRGVQAAEEPRKPPVAPGEVPAARRPDDSPLHRPAARERREAALASGALGRVGADVAHLRVPGRPPVAVALTDMGRSGRPDGGLLRSGGQPAVRPGPAPASARSDREARLIGGGDNAEVVYVQPRRGKRGCGGTRPGIRRGASFRSETRIFSTAYIICMTKPCRLRG